MFIGNCFLEYMEPYISVNFKTSVFVHMDNYQFFDYDLIEKEKTKVTVFRVAERFIDYLDELMRYYATR